MISTLNVSDSFSGNAVNRAWTYTFQILTTDGSDIQIWLTSPTGVVSQVTTSYTIDVATSTVTYPTVASLMAPLPTGWTLKLERVTPRTQAVNLINQGSLDAEVVETALDKNTAIAQEVEAEVNTGVAGPTGATGSMLAAGGITALTEKTTPADTDLLLLEDSADALSMKKIQKSNLVDSGTTANKLLRLDGSAKIPAVDGSQITGIDKSGAIIFPLDNVTDAIVAATQHWISVPFACTLTGWDLLADVSGAIKIDVWKDTYANYPPTNADTLTNGHEPAIAASGTKATDADISDWTSVAVTAGDVIMINVDSCATIKKCVFVLKYTRP